jgi:hypothetical protein
MYENISKSVSAVNTMKHSEELCKKYLDDPGSTSLVKIGKPFEMPPDLEIKAINHILSIQDLGLGLTVR